MCVVLRALAILLLAAWAVPAGAQAVVKTRVTGAAAWSSASTWIKECTGTASFSSVGVTVTGTGTQFLSEVQPGDVLMMAATPGTVLGTVASVQSDTSLMLTLPSQAVANGAFGVQRVPTATDTVEIGNTALNTAAVSVTLNVTTAQVGGLRFPATTFGNTLTHTGTNTLDVSGQVQMAQPTGSATNLWSIGGGSAHVGGSVVLLGSSSSSARIRRITVNGAGLLRIDSNLVYNQVASANAANAVVDLSSGTPTMRIGGSLAFSGPTSTGTLSPGSGSTVIFDGTGTQSIGDGSSISYRNLTIDKPSGAASFLTTCAITGNFLLQQGTVNAGSVSLTVSGSWTNNGTYARTTGGVSVTGNFLNNGTFTATGNASLSVAGNWTNWGAYTPGTGTLTLSNTANQVLSGNATQTLYNVTVNKTAGSVTASGITRINLRAFTLTNGTFTAPDTMDLSSSFSLTAGTYTAGSQTYVAGNWVCRTLNFNHNSGTVTLDGTTTQYIGGNQVTTFQNLRIANTSTSNAVTDTLNIRVLGTMDLALSTTTFTLNAGVVINPGAAAGTLTGLGTVRCTRLAATPDFLSQYLFNTYTLSGLRVEYSAAGPQTVNALAYGRLSITGTGTKTAAGNISATGLNVSSSRTLDMGTHALSGTLTSVTMSGTLITANTSSAPFPSGRTWAGTVQLTGSSAQSVPGGTYTNLNIATAGFATANGAVSVSGTLTLSAATTLDMASFNMSGTLSTLAGTGALRTASTSTTPLPASKTWPYPVTYYATTGGQSVVGGTYSTLTLAHTSGTSTAVASVTINTALVASGGGTFSGGSQTLTARGSWTVSGGSTFAHTGTVTFAGTGGNQTVISAGNFGNVTVNKTTGNVVLGSDVTINGTLTFTLGKVVTGSYVLTSNSGTFSNAQQTTGWVVGLLRIPFSTVQTTRTFAVGGPTYYAPCTVALSGVTAAGSITASTTPGTHPAIATSNILTTRSLPRYWTLASSGGLTFSTYTVALSWNVAENYPGLNPSQMSVAHYDGTAWTLPPGTGTPTTSSISVTGISTMGDFIVGDSCNVSATITYGTGTFQNTGTATVTHSGDGGGTYSAPAGLSINATTGEINLGASTPGYYTVSYIIPAGLGCGTYTATARVLVYNILTWTGASGTAWTIANNWNPTGVPTEATRVVIPTGLSNYPLVSTGVVNVWEAVLNAPTSITVSGGTLKIGGAVSGTGKLTASAGTIVWAGEAQQTISSGRFVSNEVLNMTSENEAGLLLAGPLTVRGILKISVGTFTTGGHLTLGSTATRTALIDGSGVGIVDGIVTMQRYLPQRRGYKYIASPFSDATVDALSDDISLTDPFPRLYRYNEDLTTAGWEDYTGSTTAPLVPGAGYAANFGATGGPHTLDISGTVTDGAVSFPPLTHNNHPFTQGFNLVGNPYPSPIDWDAAAGWNRVNIDNAVYFFNAGTTDAFTGVYSSYVNGVSSNGIAGPIIAAMQGFFVHVTPGTFPVAGEIEIGNAARTTGTNPAFHKIARDTTAILRLAARFDEGPAAIADGAAIYFDDAATPGFDRDRDALKILNTDADVPNLYSLSAYGERMSISATPLPSAFREPAITGLGLEVGRAGWVSISAAEMAHLPAGMNVFLADAQTATSLRLRPGASHRVHLEKGTHAERFYLLFSESENASLPWKAEELSAYTAGRTLCVWASKPGGELTVLNTLGQVVHTQRVASAGLLRVPLEAAPGIYIVSLADESGRRTKKVYLGQ